MLGLGRNIKTALAKQKRLTQNGLILSGRAAPLYLPLWYNCP